MAKKQQLVFRAFWEPTPDAGRLWDEAIDLLAEGLADLYIAQARAELAAELGRSPDTLVHDDARALTDDARRAADLPLRAGRSR